jgi:hypothetical protein
MQLFKDNDFPKRLYKAGQENINGKFVSNKNELREANLQGWQESPIGFEYPKWVGPPDVQELIELKDGQGKTYYESKLISKGGKICDSAEKEQEHLEFLKARESGEEEGELVGAKRGPGRPKKTEAAA